MAEDHLLFQCDASGVLLAFDRFPLVVTGKTLEACRITAENIAAEARARAPRRREKPTKAQAGRPPIEDTIEITEHPWGYVVSVQGHSPDALLLPWWLEFGTIYTTAQPFFLAAARLEEAAHLARVQDALGGAIEQVGLGR